MPACTCRGADFLSTYSCSVTDLLPSIKEHEICLAQDKHPRLSAKTAWPVLQEGCSDTPDEVVPAYDRLITENAWTYFGKTPRGYLSTLLPAGWSMQFPVGGSTGYRSMERGTLARGAGRPAAVTRTMVGLRNLQVFRGEFKGRNVDLQRMMVGPCHFYGTLASDIGVTSYKFELPSVCPGAMSRKPLCSAFRESSKVHMEKLLSQQHCVASEKPPPESAFSLHGIFSDMEKPATTLTAGHNNTGVFLLDEEHWPQHQQATTSLEAKSNAAKDRLAFETLDAGKYDLQRFGVQVIKNGEEFAIPGILRDQDDLQLITYWWGEDYFDHCLAHDDGAFLETHDFPQTITPLSEDCGGHLLLARPVSSDMNTALEVVAVHIPYGYTMILGKNSWHGDMGLKGLHLMAMTANHLIMEGTTKSWFLKTGTSDAAKKPGGDSTPTNFKYQVHYGVGSREHRQAGESGQNCRAGRPVPVKIPAELRSIVSSGKIPSGPQGVRCQHWSMFTDEVIRKYAPWSTPSSERVAVAPQDAQLFRNHSLPVPAFSLQTISTQEDDEVYSAHQHDLVHRFDHGSVQLHETCYKTVGPISPFWYLRLPRTGKWRSVIGRVVGRTLAGDVRFTVKDVWSDATVDDVLDMIDMPSLGASFSIISPGTDAEVLLPSEVLSHNYPDPDVAQDGVTELTVTVVAQPLEQYNGMRDDEGEMPRRWERPLLSFFFGLIKLQK